MRLLYTVIKLSPVGNKPVYLYKLVVLNISQLIVASVPTCLKHVASIKFRISITFTNSKTVIRSNIKYVVLVLLSFEYKLQK